MPPANTKESALLTALVRATPFLRARLVDAIDLKRAPDLRFVCDGFVVDDDEGESESGGDAFGSAALGEEDDPLRE